MSSKGARFQTVKMCNRTRFQNVPFKVHNFGTATKRGVNASECDGPGKRSGWLGRVMVEDETEGFRRERREVDTHGRRGSEGS